MDFILQREFFHPEVQTKVKNKKTTENVTNFPITLVQIVISSYVFSIKDQIMMVGLSNGKVFYWKKKHMEQKYLVQKGKDPELIEL